MNRINSNLFDSKPEKTNLFGKQPNMKNYNVTPIKELLTNAKSALIAVPQLSIDSIGSALALALALKKKGLDVKVFSPQKTDNNYSKLSGLDLLVDTISAGDLVVSLNYPLDQIDAVSYNDDGGRLNLVVKTKADSPKIQNDQLSINNQSSSADLCFMLGDETQLGAQSEIVNRGNWVFVSPQPTQKPWAKTSIIDPDAPFSEIFTFLLPMLDLPLDMDSGKNLLIGLRVSTQSFSVNVSPESFEAGAICLRATQPEEQQPAGIQQPIEATPIENIEKTGNISPGTNKPNPTPLN